MLGEADLDYVGGPASRRTRTVRDVLRGPSNVMPPILVERRSGSGTRSSRSPHSASSGSDCNHLTRLGRPDRRQLPGSRVRMVDGALPGTRDRVARRRGQPRLGLGPRCSSGERAALELGDLDIVYRVRGIDRPVLEACPSRSPVVSRTGSWASRMRQVDRGARDRPLPGAQRARLGARSRSPVGTFSPRRRELRDFARERSRWSTRTRAPR